MRPLLVFVLLFILMACAKPPHVKELDRALNDGVDVMTYEQAAANWGAPAELVLDDDDLKAVWRTQYRSSISVVKGNLVHEIPISHGWELQLFFDKQTRRLSDWEYAEW